MKKMLTINEAAKLCSTSRASLLRMEEKGILEPAFINQENGYRYYDEKSVLRIMRNLSFQEMGVTQKELKAYYNGDENYHDLLHTLEKKLIMLENYIATIKAQLPMETHLNVETYQFPEEYCYVKKLGPVKDHTEVRGNMWRILDECISKGYILKKEMHPFIMVDPNQFIREDFSEVHFMYKVCVPIKYSETLADNSDIEMFPTSKTISTFLYGGSKDIKKAFVKLGKLMEEEKLTLDGAARIVALVMSYPGEEIPKEYWVSRICMPFKTKQDD